MSPGRLRSGVLTVVTVVAALTTAGLGRWQLQRAAYKESLQAQWLDASAMVPVELSGLVREPNPDGLRHKRARVRGHWLAQHSVYLDNRTQDARAGFVVVTPLQTEPGGQVLVVQRGWIPRDAADRRRVPAAPTRGGVIELEGELEPAPGHRLELGARADEGPIRQNLDLDDMARALRLPVWSLTLRQTSDSGDGLSRHWPARDAGVATHYGYAFQWFALSALIVSLYGWFQIRPHFRRRA